MNPNRWFLRVYTHTHTAASATNSVIASGEFIITARADSICVGLSLFSLLGIPLVTSTPEIYAPCAFTSHRYGAPHKAAAIEPCVYIICARVPVCVCVRGFCNR